MKVWVPIVIGSMLAGCATAPSMSGKFVEMEGRRAYIHCSGPENSQPTVVIEAGHRAVAAYYVRLHRALEKDVRVCSYDRAGLGFSESRDTPRDSKQMARELHDLLVSTNVRAPYVIAGHSIGGLIAVRYAYDFPNEVAGVALLDATHPENYTLFGNSREGTAAAIKSTKRLRWLTWTGLSYIYTPASVKRFFEPLPDDARNELLYIARKPSLATSLLNTTVGELEGMENSFAQVAEVKTLKDLPLLVITADKYYVSSAATPEYRAWRQQQADGWRKLHEKYAALSTQSRHVVMKDATHETLFTDQANANQAAKEIVGLLERIR